MAKGKSLRVTQKEVEKKYSGSVTPKKRYYIAYEYTYEQRKMFYTKISKESGCDTIIIDNLNDKDIIHYLTSAIVKSCIKPRKSKITRVHIINIVRLYE